jgi:hypothetical protein
MATKKKSVKGVSGKKSASKKPAAKNAAAKRPMKVVKQLPPNPAKFLKPGERKTFKTDASVDAFLKRAAADRYADCQWIVEAMSAAVGEPAKMWGSAIVGFGTYILTYADGRQAPWCVVAFSPRKSSLVLYLARSYPEYPALLKRLGKAKLAGGCLHVKQLADVDTTVLTEMIQRTVTIMRNKYPAG